MESILLVAQFITLLCVSALSIYLIIFIVRAKDVLNSFQEVLSDFGQRSKPILENLEFITERTRSIVVKIDEQVGLAKGSLESVKQAADNLLEMEQRLRMMLEEPVMRIGSIAAAIINRISRFFDRSRSQEL